MLQRSMWPVGKADTKGSLRRVTEEFGGVVLFPEKSLHSVWEKNALGALNEYGTDLLHVWI